MFSRILQLWPLDINWGFPVIECNVSGAYVGPKVLIYMASERPKNVSFVLLRHFHFLKRFF